MFAGFDELRGGLTNGTPKTLVAAAAHDLHTLEAIYAAAKEFPLKYILVGNRNRIMDISSKLGCTPNPNAIVDAGSDAECARKAVALVHDGLGDVLMKGILESGILLKTALEKNTGVRSSVTLSHLAVLEVPAYRKLIGVTDGGMLPTPTLEQKADIVRNTVSFYRRLGYERPKIAALCASEAVSGKIPETVDAAKLQLMCRNGELGDCLLEGPLSFDIAVSPEAAAIKGVSSMVSGDADVFLVPNITAGNVLSKGLIHWGGAKMAGCILGAKVPIVLGSRSATAEEKLFSIMLCI